MEKTIMSLEEGARCNAWNYSGQRMAAGYVDGSIHVYDTDKAGNSAFTCTSKWKAHAGSIIKLVWGPSEFGDVITSTSEDRTVSLWEEVEEDAEPCTWRLCVQFQDGLVPALDIQFGHCVSGLKLVVAYADGHVKIYESRDALELKRWQLQAEFQNVNNAVERFGKCLCLTASIAWNPYNSTIQQPTFILGYNSNLAQFNGAKIWEFVEVHQRWHPIGELTSPGEEGEQVHAISWAPNIGRYEKEIMTSFELNTLLFRPYELIAVATGKGVSIWHAEFHSSTHGRPVLKRVALLSGHDGEVWQLDWDMGGMTLATSGSDGTVRLWQSNLHGVWQEQAVIESC